MMVTPADMMLARDAVARAYHAMNEAQRADQAAMAEGTCLELARRRKAWKNAVLSREALERQLWAQQAASAARLSA